jgi:plasmid stabilization system protein ParE
LSSRLPLQVTHRAAREIRAASKWWDKNRPAAPEAFRESLEEAFALLGTQPHLGTVATNVKLPGARRLHLSRIHYYLYYRIQSEPGTVEVIALWHTSRYPDLKL